MLFCENRQGDTKLDISLSKKLGILRRVDIFIYKNTISTLQGQNDLNPVSTLK